MSGNQDDKMEIILKGKDIEPEAVKVARAIDLVRKDMLASSAIGALAEQSKHWKELMTPLSGSIAASAMLNAELSKVGRVAEIVMGHANAASTLAMQVSAIGEAAKHFSKMYRSPLQGELDKISAIASQSFEVSNKVATLFQSPFDEVRRVAEALHTPWLNSQNVAASIQGVAGLSSIGKVLRDARHPFEKSATHFLRDQLGDWRSAHSLVVLDDPVHRSDFYVQQGLNSDLIEYPSSAFDEMLNATHIRPVEITPIISKYNLSTEIEPEESEVPSHAIEAFRMLHSFENRMRKFIDDEMTKHFGLSWIKHRVPGDMKKRWGDKRSKALDSGEPEHPLICYADFTEYETIIVRKDNWGDVFKAVFRNKSSVSESLRRLYPLRNPTMHSRAIISDDMLYLMAETRRILKAIEKHG